MVAQLLTAQKGTPSSLDTEETEDKTDQIIMSI